MLIGFGRETGVGERRVALVPDAVARVRAIGLEVLVESGAGAEAWFPDQAYAAAGARVVDLATLYKDSDVLVCLHPPAPPERELLRAGQVLIGLLAPLFDPQLVHDLVAAKVTAISLDGLPRRLSRAQAMDALTSQSNVAGYKAALVAADAYDGYLPMLMTAAGTIRPATVLVIGAGVAGLQAISTARRLGAVVTGYDVRDEARADVASTGAAFLELGAQLSAGGADGYARVLTAPERDEQRAAMVRAVGRFDIVITTAQVPGGIPPMVVSADAVAAMAPGSVVVDISASSLGGNVEGAVPDARVMTDNGVTIIGAGNLPAEMPRPASTAYSRNIAALLGYLVHDGELGLDTADEIIAGVLVTRDGEVVRPDVRIQQGQHR